MCTVVVRNEVGSIWWRIGVRPSCILRLGGGGFKSVFCCWCLPSSETNDSRKRSEWIRSDKRGSRLEDCSTELVVGARLFVVID